ncbi:MAG: large conductance mechanosensitive channel protein MscL [Kineosporiaceae bacterium]
MIKGFKDFLMRGNVVDLAIAVVVGAAFGKITTAIVEGVITPLIAALFGEPNLDSVGYFKLNDAEFFPGTVLTAVVNFVLIAAAIYFLVVVPMNHLAARRKAGEEPAPAAPAEDILLLTEIRDLLAQRRDA